MFIEYRTNLPFMNIKQDREWPIENILGAFWVRSWIVSTPNWSKLVSTGSTMTHKKSPDARLLIFCLSLIRYGNITTTRSLLITSRWSLWSPPFQISCIIRSCRRSKIRWERETHSIFAGCTPAAPTQIYLSAITLSHIHLFIYARLAARKYGLSSPGAALGRKPNLDKTEIQIRSVERRPC